MLTLAQIKSSCPINYGYRFLVGISTSILMIWGGAFNPSLTTVCHAIPNTNAPKPKTAVSNSGPDVAGTLVQTTITGVDPKTGKLLWKANAQSAYATHGAAGAIGDMHSAVVTLYQHGLPEAVLYAPTVHGDLGSKTVTGSGGVVLKTLSKGPKTTVRCDSVVWHSDTNMMIGNGHVVISGPGYVQTGPSFEADTKMQSAMIPAPGSRQGVHAIFSGGQWNPNK